VKKILSILSFLLLPAIVNASDISTTKITQVLVGPSYGNKVFLTLSVKPTGLPSCQINTRYNYVFDGTTESGKMTLSVVLAAYATQNDVWLAGKNTCSFNSTVEDLKHIVVK